MSSEKRTALEAQAREIRDEHAIHANTAKRIGDMLLALISYVDTSEAYLSRLADDTAAGHVGFLKGIGVGAGDYGIDAHGAARLRQLVADVVMSAGFTSDDLVGGKGLHIYVDDEGRSHVVSDYISARMKAYFAEVVVEQVTYSGGNEFLSAAGSTVARVAPTSDINGKGWKCHFLREDGDTLVKNPWSVGDQALLKTFNLSGKTANRFSWRLVTSVGTEELEDGRQYGYVVLSDESDPFRELHPDGLEGSATVKPWDGTVFYPKAAGSDTPQTGDALVQVGSQTDKGRMKAMQLVCTALGGERAPALNFYSGICGYELGTPTLSLGPDGIVGEVKMSDVRIVDSAGEPVSVVNYRGEWDAGLTYRKNDMVVWDGQSWIWNGPDLTTGTSPSEAGGWTLAAQKGGKGDDGTVYQVVITADGGTIIRAGERTKTLRARVLENGTDITSRLPSIAFSWIRRSGNDDADGLWNDAHKGVGNEITISDADVFSATQFDCVVSAEI